MNLKQSLSLTPKGEDELKNRVYKLDMKKRNVLILVQQPRTIQYVMDKAVFDAKELLDEIVALAKEGFLKISGDAGAAANSSASSAEKSKLPPITFDGNIVIHQGIVLSEARFLVVDYCLEVFKTNSTQYIEKLSQCKTVEDFTQCAKEICEATKSAHPDYLGEFQAVLKEVNKTAM